MGVPATGSKPVFSMRFSNCANDWRNKRPSLGREKHGVGELPGFSMSADVTAPAMSRPVCQNADRRLPPFTRDHSGELALSAPLAEVRLPRTPARRHRESRPALVAAIFAAA